MAPREIQHLSKLNIGCGNDIRPDFVNLDVAALPGVDVVCDLEHYPWQFEDNRFEEIILINVLEHLSDTIAMMEELWRIAKPGAKVVVRVPYWNCVHAASDPTHKKQFSQFSMNFFDPSTKQGKERPYYSKARFAVSQVHYWLPLMPFGEERYWIKVSNPFVKAVLGGLALYLNNIIWVLEFELTAIKPYESYHFHSS